MRLLLRAALAGAAALSGCGAEPSPAPPAPALELQDPVASLQAFYDALAAGDAGRAVRWMLPLSDPVLSDALAKNLGETIRFASTGELRLEAKEARVAGDWALVVARHALEGDVLIHGELLHRTAEGWRVASQAVREDPALASLWDEDAQALEEWFEAGYEGFVERYR